MAKQKLSALCHCGTVQIRIDRRPRALTSCNCSICRRYGALWAYYSRKTARIVSGTDAVSAYIWGDKLIEFYHCTVCGCLTHYESVEKTADSRFVVNARMMDPAVIADLRVKRFDGATSWKYLED